MKKIFLLISIFLLMIAGPFSASAMTITPYDNATNLAAALEGEGVTISNATYTGAAVASGYFTGGGAAGIGIESGIVLTSGFASHLNGTSNTADNITGNNGLAGDAQLDALIPGYSTNDATILSFDFTLDEGTTAYFNYVFGSEEYNEYVGSQYNDVFGFFVDGVNYALLPDDTAVSINNVNNTLHPAYYNDNDPSDLGTPTPFAFEYDGFTTMMIAELSGLTPGQTYNIQLAIADAGDHILDSGVFIQGGSFSDTPIPEPSTMILFGIGLLGFAGISRKK